jgi:putative tryptophan/tyrosine transport system substrate-binding protein
MAMWCSTLGCLITLTLSLLVTPFPAVAQPRAKLPVIGLLDGAFPSTFTDPKTGPSALRQGLRDLGYLEGQTVVMTARWAEGHDERLPALAAELVRLPVEVLVAVGPAAVRAATRATATVPIVAIDLETDPVASGLVASLARPGGNLTGVFLDMPELGGKWLEFLIALLGRVPRVAVLGDPAIHAPQFRTLDGTARRLAVPLLPLTLRAADEFTPAFEAAVTGGAEALLLLSAPLVSRHRGRLADLAVQHRLPAMSLFPSFAEAGGLLAYGVAPADMGRRGAVFVDKLLRGAKPADLPIERPMAFKLVINLRTAQALGLTIPPTLLFQADEVIQ